MSTMQEVHETGERTSRSPRRFLLLLSVPVALAAVGGVIAAQLAPGPVTGTRAAAIDPAVREVSVGHERPASDTVNVLAAVVAPKIDVDFAANVPTISVSFAPEPPASTPQGHKGGPAVGATAKNPTAKTSRSSPVKSPTKKSSSHKSFEAYCASPSAPHSPGGSVKGLLTAANKERARIGVKPLTWSGSLASAATAWSKSMAAKDKAGDGGALAHNPNRPGAENVAMAGSSKGMSTGTAVNKAHSGWIHSSGHCRNLMNPQYSTMGAGSAATANGKVVYTTANYR